MSRRKRNQLKRKLKRENRKPLEQLRFDLMRTYSRVAHQATCMRLAQARWQVALLFVLTWRVSIGDTATAPVVNFVIVNAPLIES